MYGDLRAGRDGLPQRQFGLLVGLDPDGFPGEDQRELRIGGEHGLRPGTKCPRGGEPGLLAGVVCRRHGEDEEHG